MRHSTRACWLALTLVSLLVSACGWDGLGSQRTRYLRCAERAAKNPTESGVRLGNSACRAKYPNHTQN